MSEFIRKLSMKVTPNGHKGSETEVPSSIPSAPGSEGATPVTSSNSGSLKESRRSTSLSLDSSDPPEEATKRHHSIRQSISGHVPFKNARHELINKLHLGDDSSPELVLSPRSDPASKTQLKKQEKREAMEAALLEGKDHWHEQRSSELHKRLTETEELPEKEESPGMKARYGSLPINNYGGEYVENDEIKLSSLTKEDIGKVVTFKARIHLTRKMSSKLVFLVLRQQLVTIQGLLLQSENASSLMLHWLEHLSMETLVLVKGLVQAPQAKQGEVTNATIHDKEIFIHEVHIIATVSEPLPFTVAEAEVTEEEASEKGSHRHQIGDRARLQNRILDLRSSASHAIFKVQSGVSGLFRSYLDSQNFIEIHSPKLQGGATESGASVFKVNYFDRTAFLAQSPQLAKQMSIAADFGRVYEVGAVFRAENSNTHRHLTEYTGLDLEMAIDKHYHEARNMIDATLKSIFKGVYERYRPEIEIIKRQFPHEDLVWLDETPMIPFKEAITMLNETGWLGENGKPLPLDEDLGTRDEIQLGRMMKEKFKTDYYIIDKFPASARPFYTMPDPHDPVYTNSFDIFVRGQEIVSGGQRVHDARMLVEQMRKVKVDPKVMEEYMQGFEWAAPPHAGAGIGLERLLMLLLQLGDIRHSSMYPRDPKSLPAKAVVKALRHPEASTLAPHHGPNGELQPLEKLIANYGDASNTSWLEPRFKIWRDEATGAAIGYVPNKGFAITVGNPLCHPTQYVKVISNYITFVKKEANLKLIWLLCNAEVEDCLASKFDYRTFTCVSEQRVDLTKMNIDSEVQRKLRHASKEGVKMYDLEIGAELSEDFKTQVDELVKSWLAGRKSHQHVHLTDVHPWQDVPHRQFHYALDSTGKMCVLVILAQLSNENGWQVKFSLDLPGSPSGSVETAITHAFKYLLDKNGAKQVTFGASASPAFTPTSNLKGAKVKMLSKAYHTIVNELKLLNKSEFREKLGAKGDPVYLCYPPKGLGPNGVSAILSFFDA